MTDIAGWVPLDEDGPEEYPTNQAEDIIERLVPEWAKLFLRKNMSYGRVDNHLGPAGIFPDLNRKLGKLERTVWAGEDDAPGSEPTREVILDLIGHAFLMLHMIDEEDSGGNDPELMEAVRRSYFQQEDRTTMIDFDNVMEALRRIASGKVVTPEQAASIRNYLVKMYSPKAPPFDTGPSTNMSGNISFAEHGMPSPSTRSEYPDAEAATERAEYTPNMVAMTMEEHERLHGGDGWRELPGAVQDAILLLAGGHEVVSTPHLRLVAGQYVEEHVPDGI